MRHPVNARLTAVPDLYPLLRDGRSTPPFGLTPQQGGLVAACSSGSGAERGYRARGFLVPALYVAAQRLDRREHLVPQFLELAQVRLRRVEQGRHPRSAFGRSGVLVRFGMPAIGRDSCWLVDDLADSGKRKLSMPGIQKANSGFVARGASDDQVV
jgi:hypothetical protein